MPYDMIQSPELPIPPGQNIHPDTDIFDLSDLGLDADTPLGAPRARFYSYVFGDNTYDSIPAGNHPTKLTLSGAFNRTPARLVTLTQMQDFVGQKVAIRHRDTAHTAPTQEIGQYYFLSMSANSNMNLGDVGLVVRWTAELEQVHGSTRREVAQGTTQIIAADIADSRPIWNLNRSYNWVEDGVITLRAALPTDNPEFRAGEIPFPLNVEFVYDITSPVPSNRFTISKLQLTSFADTITITLNGSAPDASTALRFRLTKGTRSNLGSWLTIRFPRQLGVQPPGG